MVRRPSYLLRERGRQDIVLMIVAVGLLALLLFLLPVIAYFRQAYEPPGLAVGPFPVSVDPRNKTIVENPETETLLDGGNLASAAWYALDTVDVLAARVAATPLYDALATAGAPHFVVIEPGQRKEEIARAFGKALSWSTASEEAFLALREESYPHLPEGSFSPGVYLLARDAREDTAEQAVDERFKRQVLSRYATSTMEIVPLEDALTLASIIQRETADRDEMRIISGILWNRIFAGMRLQVDATLQYVRANETKGTTSKRWWPKVAPRDKFIESPFNTYLHEGLPPAPIANPSISAVIAALNPVKTPCFFYFHDRLGRFHCSETYKEHVTLLTKQFGRGR